MQELFLEFFPPKQRYKRAGLKPSKHACNTIHRFESTFKTTRKDSPQILSQAQLSPLSQVDQTQLRPDPISTSLEARQTHAYKKATRLGGFQVSMVSEAGFEPARPVCGH